MTYDGLTETQRAWLDSQHNREAFADLSAAEINKLSFTEFARRTGRPSFAESAVASLDAAYEAQHARQSSASAPAPAQSTPAPQQPGIDIGAMDMDQYAQVRDQLGMGQGSQYGRGIFDSAPSQSQAYTDAARGQAGRTSLSNANVVQPPRIEGRYLDPDEIRDTRTTAQRFATPGNAWQWPTR